MTTKNYFSTLIFIAAFLGLNPTFAQSNLYFNVTSVERIINHSLLTQTNTTVVDSNLAYGFALAIDTTNEHIYFGRGYVNEPSSIDRCNFDGTNRVRILDGLGAISDIIVNRTGEKLIWLDNDHNLILQANLDGSELDTLLEVDNPIGLVQSCTGSIYFTENHPNLNPTISRMDEDGTNVEVLHSSGLSSARLAFDCQNQMLYWTDDGAQSIYRSDAAISSVELFKEFPGEYPFAIHLDKYSDRVYWTIYGPTHRVMSSKLDGSQEITHVTEYNNPRSIGLSYHVNTTKNTEQTYHAQLIPNPVYNRSTLNIQGISGEWQAFLYSIDGVHQMQFNGFGEMQVIDCSALHSGNYFLTVRHSNGTSTIPFSKI